MSDPVKKDEKDDLVGFCLPDFSKCGPGASDLGPNFNEAIQYFTGFTWFDFTMTGSKAWAQNPSCNVIHNIPLCIGAWLVPCCCCAVHLRSLSKMTDKSCESLCLSLCILNLCCPFFCCYYAKKRGEFRKKYDLEGSEGLDCLGQCCFSPCMVCQDANEVMVQDASFAVPFCHEGAAGKKPTEAPKPAEATKAADAKPADPKP